MEAQHEYMHLCLHTSLSMFGLQKAVGKTFRSSVGIFLMGNVVGRVPWFLFFSAFAPYYKKKI